MASGDTTTISASYATALLEMAVSRGAGRAALLESSRLEPGDLEDPDNRILIERYVALMKAGARLCRAPAFPLLFGEEVTSPDISIVALIAQAAETTGEGLAQVNRYARLMIDGDDIGPVDLIEKVREGGQVWLVLPSSIYVRYPQVTESAFARMAVSFRRQYGDRPFIREVHFTHSEPGYRAEFDRIFRVPVFFDSSRNALLIDESCLSLKMKRPSRYVFGILSEHADALLRRLEASRSVKGRVKSLMVPALHTGEVTMDRVAGELGLSRQTLYRRLKAEGVTFEAVLDELRHEMALHYLRGKKVSVKEAAYLVGFSEPSAFSRAFRRWTGRSPGRITPGSR